MGLLGIGLVLALHTAWVLAVLGCLFVVLSGKFRRTLSLWIGVNVLVLVTIISNYLLDGQCLFTMWEQQLRAQFAPESVYFGSFIGHYVRAVGLGVSEVTVNQLIIVVFGLILGAQVLWLVVDVVRSGKQRSVVRPAIVRQQLTSGIALLGLTAGVYWWSLQQFALASELASLPIPRASGSQADVRSGILEHNNAEALVVRNLESGKRQVVFVSGRTVFRAPNGDGELEGILQSDIEPGVYVLVSGDALHDGLPALLVDVFPEGGR